jgi:hypothetical protein
MLIRIKFGLMQNFREETEQCYEIGNLTTNPKNSKKHRKATINNLIMIRTVIVE